MLPVNPEFILELHDDEGRGGEAKEEKRDRSGKRRRRREREREKKNLDRLGYYKTTILFVLILDHCNARQKTNSIC